MQRLFLKVRKKVMAIHPVTRILEESKTQIAVNQEIGIKDNIQFILRMGYLKNYPLSVTLPVDSCSSGSKMVSELFSHQNN